MNLKKWYIHTDREDHEDFDEGAQIWSLTMNPKYPGWNTDSGYPGYGLPKNVAQWICDILNECEKCPLKMGKYGDWDET